MGSITGSTWLETNNFLLKLISPFLSWEKDGYSMQEIAKKLKISYSAVYYSLQRTAQTVSNQIRKRSGRPRCTTEQEDKYIRVSSLRNRRFTSPQLAASLNSTRKTLVSTSTVKRRRRDAGLLGRVLRVAFNEAANKELSEESYLFLAILSL